MKVGEKIKNNNKKGKLFREKTRMKIGETIKK